MTLTVHVLWYAAGILTGLYTHRRLADRLADDDGTGTSVRLELVAIAALIAAALILRLALADVIEPRLEPLTPPFGHPTPTGPIV